MANAKAMKQRLIEERTLLLREVEALQNKIKGLELAISLIDGETKPNDTANRAGRLNVKQILLDLLKEAGTTGINAASAVEIAARRNLTLDRGSISSILSRLKRDQVVVYDGDRYRLPEFARQNGDRPPLTLAHGA